MVYQVAGGLSGLGIALLITPGNAIAQVIIAHGLWVATALLPSQYHDRYRGVEKEGR